MPFLALSRTASGSSLRSFSDVTVPGLTPLKNPSMDTLPGRVSFDGMSTKTTLSSAGRLLATAIPNLPVPKKTWVRGPLSPELNRSQKRLSSLPATKWMSRMEVVHIAQMYRPWRNMRCTCGFSTPVAATPSLR